MNLFEGNNRAKLMRDTDPRFGRTPYIYQIAGDFETAQDVMSYLLAPDASAAGADKNSETLFDGVPLLQHIPIPKDIFTGNSPSDPNESNEPRTDTKMDYNTFVTDMVGPGGMRPNQIDTSLGGNDAINCFYGFNEDDDIIFPLLAVNNDPEGYGGLGIVYNETYQINQSLLYLSFGIPQFTNLTKFYSEAMDASTADYVNNGETGINFANTFGSFIAVIGAAALFFTFPVITAAVIFGKGIMKIANRDSYITKYYQFRGAMPMYYRYVNTMMLILATNMKLRPNDDTGSSNATTQGTQTNQDYGQISKETEESLDLQRIQQQEKLNEDIQEFINTPQYQDLPNAYLISLLEKEYDLELSELYNKEVTREQIAQVTADTKWLEENANVTSTNYDSMPSFINGSFDIYTILSKRDRMISVGDQANLMKEAMDNGADNPDNFIEKNDYTEDDYGFFSDFLPRVVFGLQGADKYITFRLDKNTDASESISNSTGESALTGFLNSIGSAAKEAKFSTAGFNIGDGMISNAVEGVANTAQDVIQGFLSTAGVVSKAAGGLSTAAAAIQGGGLFDIPEVWKSSSFSKSYSFRMTFRTPYGNPVSIFQDEYVPLSLLLAGSLPRSVGVNSYTSPFICRAYCTGKFGIPAGIMTNLSIERGAAEFGWSRAGLPLVINVSFSIQDLSPSMHISMMGIGGPLSIMNRVLSSNSTFMEYLNTLGNLSLKERVTNHESMKKRLQVLGAIYRGTYANPNFWATEIQNNALGRFVEFIVPDSRVGQ